MLQLQHPHIVRYHTVWLEPFVAGLNNFVDDDDGGSSLASNVDLPHLYIQMELCDRYLIVLITLPNLRLLTLI